jgi:MFS family permease
VSAQDPDGDRRLLTSSAFLAVLLSALFYFSASGVLSLALPLYVHDQLGGGAVAVGVVVGAVTVTAILVRPFAGRLSTTRGCKAVALAGFLIVSTSIACYGLTDSLPILTLCRFATGLGQSAAYIGLARMAFNLAPMDRKAEATSYFSVALYGGFAVGPVLGNSLISSVGYDTTWMITAGLGFAAFGVGLFLRDRPPAIEGAPAPLRQGFLHRDSLGPALVLLLSLGGYSAFATALPLYVRSDLDADPGIAIAVNAGIVLVIRLIAGSLPDRLGTVPSATASLALQATGWLLIAGLPNLVGVYLGIAVMSIGVALLYPALFTFAMHRTPDAEHGSAVSTMTMSFDIAYGLGPVLLGVVITMTSSDRSAFVAAALLNLAALALVLRWATAWRASSPVPRRAAVSSSASVRD